jgi:hypothetical protein
MMREIILENPTTNFIFEKEVYILCEKLVIPDPESRLSLNEGLDIFMGIDSGKKKKKKREKKINK